MPKTPQTPATAQTAKWQTEWPRKGDVRLWLLCMLKKCEAMEDLCEGCSKAHLPIDSLARLGHVDESLRWVNRFLRHLPKDELLETVRMAELGAEISLKNSDESRMERFLALALAADKNVRRKCDIGFPANSVREFRASKGLLDPADAIDDEQRIEATFNRAFRQLSEAKGQGREQKVEAALAEMEQAAREEARDWRRKLYLRQVVECLAKFGDANSVKRCLRMLDKSDRESILDYDMLEKLGMRAEALQRAADVAKARLDELATMNDPNIHFPASFFCRAITFLFKHGKPDLARRWLKRALKEADAWPALEQGWTTSAVYAMLGETVAIIEGPAAADALRRKAYEDSQAERRPNWRKGAARAALDVNAGVGNADDLIAEARKLRSPTERRRRLVELLAKAGRWAELREVCSQAASPDEAAELCWAVKWELQPPT